MKIYKVIAGWSERNETGDSIPVQYADTRAEARDVARQMTSSAASNMLLLPQPIYVAQVYSCNISDRLGKGRRFAVALLNHEGVMEVSPEPLDEIRKRAATARCTSCGKSTQTQRLNPSSFGDICEFCYAENVFPVEKERMISENLIREASR